MLRNRLPRPTPSMVVALVALSIAIGGTATAATVIIRSSAQIKDGTIRVADLTPKARKALKGQVGPRGATGARGPRGLTGARGATGAAGAAGAPGSAIAFARVAADGTLDGARSKGVTSVKLTASPGYYCVDLAPGIAAKSVVASADTSGGLAHAVASLVSDNFTSCLTSGYDAVVSTFNGPGAAANQAFNVVFN